MRLTFICLSVIVLLMPLVGIGGLSSQATPLGLNVGALGGLTLPQGTLGDFFNSGWHAGGYVWVSGPAIGLRLQTDYHKMKRSGTLFGTPRYSGKFTFTAVLLQMTFSPVHLNPLKPYAMIGGGTVSSKINDYDATYDESHEYGSRDGAFSFGAGMKLPIGRASASFEIQYLIIFEPNDSLKMLMLTAGLGFPLP